MLRPSIASALARDHRRRRRSRSDSRSGPRSSAHRPQFASGARYAPTVSSRLILYSMWLLPHGNCPRVPPRHICSQVIMPPAVNMDIKVSFELFDMSPGEKGKQFIRDQEITGMTPEENQAYDATMHAGLASRACRPGQRVWRPGLHTCMWGYRPMRWHLAPLVVAAPHQGRDAPAAPRCVPF